MESQNFQEIKNKKRSLKRYRYNLACIDRLEEKLNLLDAKIKSVRSPNYSGMPRGGTPVTIEELLSDKVDLEKRIKRLKDKSKKVKDQIVEEIDSLEDPRYCEILEAYFIDRMSIEDIAEEMGYSTRWVYDLYSEAVEKLAFSITT
jgi:DNA-directed RNA polymerase specialized sigma subunit